MQLETSPYKNKIDKFFQVAAWLIIAVGIVLRLIVYFQNRSLIIDEANIARNLYERNFFELLAPLKYEQYAPPVFLWIEELLSLLLGFSEKSLKLYPLISGIVALFLLRSVLKQLIPDRSAWLPLALLAFTYFNIRYSTELKQYMPDEMISLWLVWLALRTNVFTVSKRKFLITWLLAGSLAIWASMPSVFVLTGVGMYYAWQLFRSKKWSLFPMLILIGVLWVLQFGFYYLTVLKDQAESSYLQNYHMPYFLFAWPDSMEEWTHNKMRFREIINNLGGYNQYSYYITIVLLISGFVAMLLKKTDKLILILTPIVLTIIAAAFNKFSLIDRVILFMTPLMLILLGYGFEMLMRTKLTVIQVLAVCLAIFIIKGYNEFKFFKETLETQNITGSLSYLAHRNAKGSQLFVHEAARPTYLYYTDIHPDKTKYENLKNAYLLDWSDHYNSVLRNHRDTAYFLYAGGISQQDLDTHEGEIRQVMVPFLHFKPLGSGDLFGYVPVAK